MRSPTNGGALQSGPPREGQTAMRYLTHAETQTTMKAKHIKFGCNCLDCKEGRRKGKSRGAQRMRRAERRARHIWNALAKAGIDEGWPVFSFGYTD